MLVGRKLGNNLFGSQDLAVHPSTSHRLSGGVRPDVARLDVRWQAAR